MRARTRLSVTLLSLGLGSVLGLGLWFQVRAARARQRHDLWMDYVRGPLKLYIEGSRQGFDCLSFSPPPLVKRKCLADAVLAMHAAWTQAVDMQPDFEDDAFFFDLDRATPWFTTASELEDTWPSLERNRRDQVEPARQAAEGIRANLALAVREQWSQASVQLLLSGEERAESEAAVKGISDSLR